MPLSPEQKQAVSDWIAAGDNLSTVQKKLTEQFKVSMTYRDVRFLVDDLGLELKNPAPKPDASDVTKAAVAKPAAPAAGDAIPADAFKKLMDDYYVRNETLEAVRANDGRVICVTHTLPRRAGEMDLRIDKTPSQQYFEAIAYSVSIRMALVASILG